MPKKDFDVCPCSAEQEIGKTKFCPTRARVQQEESDTTLLRLIRSDELGNKVGM